LRHRAAGDRLWPFVALAAAHLAGCLYYFPPREVFSGEPLLTGDYVLHFHEAVRARSYLRHGSFLGYCTTWMAGFPDGFVGMIKNKPFVLAVAAAPPRWQPLVFNLAVLLSLWAFPILVFAAARALGQSRSLAAVSMGLAMTAWYGSMLFRLFWRGGSVIFIVGCGVALWTAARLWSLWATSESPRSAGPVALGITAVLWIHPAAALVILFGGALTYAMTFRERGVRVGQVLVIGLVPVVLNLPWLLSYVPHSSLLGSFYYAIYQGGLDHLLFDFVRGPLALGSGPRDEVAVMGPLLVGAMAAGAATRNRPDPRWLLGALALPLAAVAYGGHALHPLAVLQPYRYAIPLAAVLAIAAAPMLHRVTRGPHPRAFAALALILLVLLANRVRSGVVHSGDYLGAGLGKREQWALEALRVAAAPAGRVTDGRVLLEGDWLNERVERRPSAWWTSYSFVGFERYLEGEFIGAEATGIGLKEGYASFWRGRLFGREFADYDRESFSRMCDLYDIGWVVTARDETRRKLESFAPSVTKLAEQGGIGIFRVDRGASRIWRGTGRARSEASGIRVETTDASAAILKYHWIPGLASTPAARLAPANVDPDSPIPFLEIQPPGPGEYVIDWDPRA